MLKQGDLEHRRDVFHQALILNPNNVDALRNLAYVAFQDKDEEKALQFLGRATAVNPKDDVVLLAIATLQLRLKRFAEVLATSDRIPRSGKKNSSLHYTRGAALDALGRKKEAVQEYRAFLEYSNDAPSTNIVELRIHSIESEKEQPDGAP